MGTPYKLPYGYLIDDSATYKPWFCQDREHAEKCIRAGKRVILLYSDPVVSGKLTKGALEDRQRAQAILRDHEAMSAIRRIRALSGVDDGTTLEGVADALEAKLRAH